MAIICTACFPKRSANLVLLRLLKQTFCEQKLIKSSPKSVSSSRDAPIQFTTNKASTVTIAETLGFYKIKEPEKKYTSHILIISSAIFLIYFCILREENELDEMLKGKEEMESDRVKLIKLNIQLQYCEKNHLPTGLLKAKIKELEEKL